MSPRNSWAASLSGHLDNLFELGQQAEVPSLDSVYSYPADARTKYHKLVSWEKPTSILWVVDTRTPNMTLNPAE